VKHGFEINKKRNTRIINGLICRQIDCFAGKIVKQQAHLQETPI
jgi:hypothetical protein